MNGDSTGRAIPHGFELARTTNVFDNETVPAGLLRAHRVAAGVWARLIVHTGRVDFLFEDEPDKPISVDAGDSIVIPPARFHHVELDGPATFVIEFHRFPGDSAAGLETTGLADPSKHDYH